jgi:L-lactate dehydrogenase complex protein LldE
VLVSSDASCLMHLGGLAHRQRAGIRTLHLAQVLASTDEAPLQPAVGR